MEEKKPQVNKNPLEKSEKEKENEFINVFNYFPISLAWRWGN
jgi:hypothetical protein